MTIDGFHVEFDTYYNSIPPHPHQDPTPEDHVAIHFNGSLDTDLDPDPNNEVSLWAAMPNLEDNFWHQIDVRVSGTNIQVDVDGQSVIDGTVPSYLFKGGMIGFSGSTGAVTNYHRFDDLVVRESCWPAQ